MPAVRKLTRQEVQELGRNVVSENAEALALLTPKKRGRPKGSKNKATVDTTGFEAEKLYTYRAKDGCEIQSAVKSSKTMSISCKHGKTMELVK